MSRAPKVRETILANGDWSFHFRIKERSWSLASPCYGKAVDFDTT